MKVCGVLRVLPGQDEMITKARALGTVQRLYSTFFALLRKNSARIFFAAGIVHGLKQFRL